MKVFYPLFAFILLSLSASAQLPAMPPRPAVNTLLAPFYHGVASGDPLSDRVIIWTRYTPTSVGSVSVNWQVATDTLFAHIVNSGTVTTDSSKDYIVKVDVTGLSANSWYYYRFISGSAISIMGRTKTLPVGDVDSIRLAVFSCSDFEAGYFNAYNDISKRNDLSAIVHLGDFYYEYRAGGGGSGTDTSRFHPFTRDAYMLSDYRLWESQYKLDQDLRAMLQQYPLIMVWDDHEVCDNSWFQSALNHDPATQGNWFVRKNAAKKAYFEWNPIRPIATGNDTIIHRNFNFGKLFNLVMLDTRLEGRDSSLGSAIPSTNTYLIDTNRKMLGTTQLNWLKSNLSDTSTRWKIVGSQVMVAPLSYNVLTTTLIANGDQWDGYPAERKRVFNHISQNHIKDVVFLSGDIHSSWAMDLPGADSTYVSATGGGSVATEFIGSSITSTAGTPPATPAAIMAMDPWFKYIEFTMRGYLLFDINKTRVQGDFIHISGTDTRSYTKTNDAQWVNLDGERHLRIASSVLGSNPGNNPPLVNPFPVRTGVNTIENDMIVFNCYPNPTTSDINIQYYLSQSCQLTISISDISGRIVYQTKTNELPMGVNKSTLELNNLTPGNYLVKIQSLNTIYTNKVVLSK